ncbi:MAG: carboxypeptidase-like regulatory domain-containing protein [Salinivirgaceae bacterium]|nr:carboxypeptidase-like regulatory domain-containing protein [Salinivirgaceae bacterium]MDD4747637.1 carboxypeptidase-like regulatory domain-containing protein [Salinivirgaceae bacterium]
MKIIILIVTLLFTISLFANDDTHTEIEAERYVISGYIRDGSNGEDLIGATVYIKELKTGTVTNVYGYYSLNLSPGVYCFVYTYLGYETVEKKINLNKNIIQNVELSPSAQMLTEVSITAEALNANITRTEMSVAKMDAKSIEKIPALMGEVDVIKAMQLLPGVSAVSEGGSGFSVRGGSVDQNLIILDEANVYNASHLIGFFSVFNNDVVKDLKLYKGDIPAEYGGRLSSVVDIRMKDGNTKKFHGKAGIGTISSRLTLEGPLWEDRTSFIVAGRRTYMDIFLPLMPDTALHNIKLYFYDLNAKLNHKIDDKNRIFFSGYFGRDVFKNQFSNMIYGNATMSARWNHLFSQKLFSNLTFTYSNYYYSLGSDITDANSFIWVAEMDDIAMKYDFGYFATPNITLN